jgi:hypothetical protein
MRIIVDGKILKVGMSNMRQALFYANNHGAALNCSRLVIEPEERLVPQAAPKAAAGKAKAQTPDAHQAETAQDAKRTAA